MPPRTWCNSEKGLCEPRMKSQVLQLTLGSCPGEMVKGAKYCSVDKGKAGTFKKNWFYRVRKGDRDRETSISSRLYDPHWGLSRKPGHVPDRELNWWPLGTWNDAQPTEPLSPLKTFSRSTGLAVGLLASWSVLPHGRAVWPWPSGTASLNQSTSNSI